VRKGGPRGQPKREKERQMNERDRKRHQKAWAPCSTLEGEKCIHEAAAEGDPDALDAILDEMHAISG
jgi:hypothetical protein